MWKTVLFLVFIYSSNASAHGGGLDSNGGHNNRKTGEYHCHREPCLSTHGQVQSATKEAARSSYSTLYDRDDWGGWIDVIRHLHGLDYDRLWRWIQPKRENDRPLALEADQPERF